jgi:hypothetical protein
MQHNAVEKMENRVRETGAVMATCMLKKRRPNHRITKVQRGAGIGGIRYKAGASIFTLMKLRTRRNIWFGIGGGWLLFFALAGIAYFTPARILVLQVAGRDHAALRIEGESRRLALEALRPEQYRSEGLGAFSAEKGAAVARARAALSENETRLAAWRRVHSRISPFGFLGWLSDLWPWLLGFGIAFPVLGGLVGAQRGSIAGFVADAGRGAEKKRVPEPTGVPTVASGTSSPPGTSAPEVEAAPVEPAAWSWNAHPIVRTTSTRPKVPPVKSPNGTMESER